MLLILLSSFQRQLLSKSPKVIVRTNRAEDKKTLQKKAYTQLL